MVNYELLTNAGIDMEKLLKRLMGNDSLIRVFIQKFTEDQTFAQLEAAFAEGDAKQAEMASHTLKGMCGNLSLEQLYGLFTEQVKLIRAGNLDQAEAMMEGITQTFEQSIADMKAWLSRL